MIVVDFVFQELWSQPKYLPPDVICSHSFHSVALYLIRLHRSKKWKKEPEENRTQREKLGVFVVWWIEVLLGSYIIRGISSIQHTKLNVKSI